MVIGKIFKRVNSTDSTNRCFSKDNEFSESNNKPTIQFLFVQAFFKDFFQWIFKLFILRSSVLLRIKDSVIAEN